MGVPETRGQQRLAEAGHTVVTRFNTTIATF
jgi:hypothetical protein